jgi:hypothetical protein
MIKIYRAITNILVIGTMLVLAACAATENITVNSHAHVPFVYQYIEYEHPVDAVYFGDRVYPYYQHHNAYIYMSNVERLAVDHYLRSLNHCYSGNWFIESVSRQSATLIEGDNGRRCDDVMRVYRNLYTQGYSWQSLSDVIGRGPFFTLLKVEDECKKTGATLGSELDEKGAAHFYCDEKL